MAEKPKLVGIVRGETAAQLIDLSLGGARLRLSSPLAPGDICDLALELNGERLWVQAEVRRCLPTAEGSDQEVGVQFVGIAPHDQKRLQDFLARRQ